jgi:alpha-L-fucosidase
MKKNILYLSMSILCFCASPKLFAQKNKQQEEDRIKMEHAQIGIVDNPSTNYKHTTHPGAQWFGEAGFGMFIHWSIASINEIDLSWPMMPGAQITRKSPKLTNDEVKKIMDSGNFFTDLACEKDGTCVTPNQYWDQAKKFNPSSYNPDTWVKLAKEAGMTYVVLTTRHHDGFALWPSKYGDFNTKNYMGGRDLVKEYVAACRKYGVKVGLYYSGPDWYFNRDFQSFLYYGVSRDYPNIPAIDADLHVRTTVKTAIEKQKHYEDVAVYIKGQVEELLTNYGKIDMIWFDGGPDIPKGNEAWKRCISMERIHQLQPGIIVSPRFFGYGDYKTFEGDNALPKTVQNDWAELCTTSANYGWGYTKSPIKSSTSILNKLALCRSNNANLLLNFGPTKEGVFTTEMVNRLKEMAEWMKVNGVAIKGTHALNTEEQTSVPAVANVKHRYLFVMPKTKDNLTPPSLPLPSEIVTLKISHPIKSIQLLGKNVNIKYEVNNNEVTISVPSEVRTINGNVLDVSLK